MTDEERRLLHDALDQVRKNGEMTQEIYEALFEVPRGSPPDEKPLIEMMRVVVKAWKTGSWGFRAMVWLILTAGSVTVAVREISRIWLSK